MKTSKNVVDLTQRIKTVLSKNRSSLSAQDVILLERCIFYFNKMRIAKSDQAKKEYLSKGISCWIKFLAKNEILDKYSDLLKSLENNTD
ncbi:MAG: hypothetical protein WCL06_01815 [Bacteroidota bacterium]